MAKWEAAIENFDWGQPQGRNWNPCFRIMEDGHCCGRAQRWAGHEPGHDHEHISLVQFIRGLLAAGEKEPEAPKPDTAKPVLPPLSKEEREARKPIPPAIAMNALHGDIRDTAKPGESSIEEQIREIANLGGWATTASQEERAEAVISKLRAQQAEVLRVAEEMERAIERARGGAAPVVHYERGEIIATLTRQVAALRRACGGGA